MLIVILALSVFVRVHLIDVPLERDEAEYAYSARFLLKGIPLYTQSYEFLKLPGLYAIYAVFLGVFGNSATGIHTGLLVVNSLTVILIFFLAKRLMDTTAGITASATFALVSLSQRVLGISTNAEPLLLLPVVGGTLLLLRAMESRRLKDFFLSGLVLGMAAIIKQPAFYFVAFALFYLVYSQMVKDRLRFSQCAAKLEIFVLGIIIPFALVCVFMQLAGVFDKFIFWTFEYALAHGSVNSLSKGFGIFRSIAPWIIAPASLFWFLAAVGLSAIYWDDAARKHAVFLIGFLAASFLALSLGLFFRPHYFILTLPAVALLTGTGVSSLTRLMKRSGDNPVIKWAPVIITALAAIVFLASEGDYLFFQSPHEVSRSTYGANPFVESIKIARYIKERTSPDDRIAVLGSQPEIFFYADRLSASRFTVLYTLTGGNKFAVELQEEMIRDIQAAHPKYLVYVNTPASWAIAEGSKILLFRWLKAYVPTRYDRIGLVDILYPEPSKYYWDADLAGVQPSSKLWISIYKRKE